MLYRFYFLTMLFVSFFNFGCAYFTFSEKKDHSDQKTHKQQGEENQLWQKDLGFDPSSSSDLEKGSLPPGENSLLPSSSESPSVQPSVALILGPGGWRFFAHAGVLSELHKAGYKVVFISGLEKSVLPAMLYADNPGVSQVEWQLFKLKVEDLVQVPSVTFKNRKTENFPIPFGCPSYALTQRRSYLLTKGLSKANLSLCYQQFSENPKGLSFANPMDVELLLEKAYQYSKNVIYIDILSHSEIEVNVEGYQYALWSEALLKALKHHPHVQVISVPLKGQSRDFSQRQEWMRTGAEVLKQHLFKRKSSQNKTPK
jgi:hypothetical protein